MGESWERESYVQMWDNTGSEQGCGHRECGPREYGYTGTENVDTENMDMGNVWAYGIWETEGYGHGQRVGSRWTAHLGSGGKSTVRCEKRDLTCSRRRRRRRRHAAAHKPSEVSGGTGAVGCGRTAGRGKYGNRPASRGCRGRRRWRCSRPPQPGCAPTAARRRRRHVWHGQVSTAADIVCSEGHSVCWLL